MSGPTRAGMQKQLAAMAAAFSPGARSLVDEAGLTSNYSPAVLRGALGWGMDPALGAPLPRDPRVFLSMYGPNIPASTSPIDPRGPGAGPLPRLNQYPQSWNLPSPPGTYKMVPFRLMRSIVDMSHVARDCIDVRQQEIADVEFEIAPKEEERGEFRVFPEKKAGLFDQWRSQRKALQAFYEHPDPVRGLDYDEWIRMAIEELLVTDALSVFEHPTEFAGDGINGSDLWALTILDGTTIKPLLDIRGATPASPSPAYQQFIWGLPRVDLVSLLLDARDDSAVQDAQRGFAFDKAEYFELSRDQLAYMPFHRRAWTAYGYSNVEQAIQVINLALQRQQYHQAYFTDGDIPAMLLYTPDTWTLDQNNKFEAQWHAKQAGSAAWKQRVNVVPGAIKADQLKPPQYDMTFDDYVDRMICASFAVDPTEVGMEPNHGQGGTGWMEAQDDRRKRLTVGPVLRRFKRYFDGLNARRFALPELEIRYDGLDVEDEAEEHKIDMERVSHALMTPNAYRAKRGEPPLMKADGTTRDPNGDRAYFVMSREVVGLDQVGTKNLDDVAAEQMQAKTQQAAGGGTGPAGQGASKSAEPDEDEQEPQSAQKSALDEVDAFERFLKRPRARKFASASLPGSAIDAAYRRLDAGEDRKSVIADLRQTVLQGSEMLASEVADAILGRVQAEKSGSLR